MAKRPAEADTGIRAFARVREQHEWGWIFFLEPPQEGIDGGIPFLVPEETSTDAIEGLGQFVALVEHVGTHD